LSSSSRSRLICVVVASLAGGSASAQTFQTNAPIALVEDYESGAVLFEKNADQPMNPAATVKLMTAEIVFNELHEGRIHLDDIMTVSENAWRTGGGHGHSTAMFLNIHSHVHVEDLIRGLVIQSGNDAAITLAEGIAGSEAAFTSLMNKRAQTLGLTVTHFANAYGKSEPDQKSTARQMATLATHLIRDYPDDYRYFGEKDFTWDKIHQLNRDPLLSMSIGADGLMGGDSADGGYGLVGSAVEDGQRLIVVINGLKTASERAEEARKLFNFGFRAFDPRTLFQPGDTVGSASVYGGAQEQVGLTPLAPVKIFVPHGSTERLVARIVYTGPLEAPIAADAEVARLKIFRGATLALDVPLKTKSAVAQGSLARRAMDAVLELAQGWVRQLFAKI
jgi:D-alanyl-D-alanine carboxypeptidase (penicillin-binding protein 5/6)